MGFAVLLSTRRREFENRDFAIIAVMTPHGLLGRSGASLAESQFLLFATS
jgi:hypothetical protein